ncbi:MAG: 16S rRNA (cytosine(1402)-N(4))-methyltransferase, partial [Planctomycetota bacterium]
TRTFQALRIAVNRELEALEHLLEAFDPMLSAGGRIGIISYHSLEDRRVKEAFRRRARGLDYELLTRSAVRPSPREIARNPRARSARLRALRRRGRKESL